MKSLIQIAVVGSTLACHALPEVVNVKVEPVSPWGKAYVTFGINEDFETNDATVAIMAHLVASNRQTHVIYEHVFKMNSLARENNHVLWDMKGSKRYFPMTELDFKVKLETWVQLWADGPYWAECNVGAQSPEDAGYSFWWGDIIGYRQNDAGKWVASDGSSDNFEFLESNARRPMVSSDKILQPEFDAAVVHLGGGCRMPTDDEMVRLCQCTKTWLAQNGCFGYKVKGRSNEIFLPVTSQLTGAYWSSSSGYYIAGERQYSTYGANLIFGETGFRMRSSNANGFLQYGLQRYKASVVRAVLDFKK